MNCPACNNAMSQVEVQGIILDVCRGGCGGIWFDAYELKKVDEKHEAAGEALLNVERNPAMAVDKNKKRNCPVCDNQVMMQHFSSVKRQVAVDECPSCAGFFLDYGELNQIREQFENEQERRAAAEKMFDDLIDEGFADTRQESEEKAKKAQGIAKMVRFLLPSYYLPGKQKWGAF